MKTILVVDDEPGIASLVRDYLEHAGFGLLVAGDGRNALALARSRRPDLVVLDLGLPGLDGLDVARALRRDSDVPILMLTARTDEADRVAGLELGADDYVSKPFSPREIVTRVRAILRRTEIATTLADAPIRVLDVELDPARLSGLDRRSSRGPHADRIRASRDAGAAARAGLHRSQLLDAIHGVAFEAYQRAIDGHVKNLRRKLERTRHIRATS